MVHLLLLHTARNSNGNDQQTILLPPDQDRIVNVTLSKPLVSEWQTDKDTILMGI